MGRTPRISWRVYRRGQRIAAVLAVTATLMVGCSGGKGSAQFGGAFALVSPGGQTELDYIGSQRKALGAVSGPYLTQDGSVSVSDYPNEVVVLNFWGSWCAPCRAEATDLNLASTLLGPKGVQFIGVDIKDTREGGADFHAAKKVPYPSIFDPKMQILLSMRGYPASSIPSTVVLDRSHEVAHIWLRPVTVGEVVHVITPLTENR